MESKTLLIEARAKIIWGDPPESVHAYLTSNGMSQADADANIKRLMAERNREIRDIAFRNLLIGLALVSVAGFSAYLFRPQPATVRHYKGIIFAAVMGMIGIWKLIQGIIYLVRPQFDQESVSEISD